MRTLVLVVAMAVAPLVLADPPACTDDQPVTKFDVPTCNAVAAMERMAKALERGDLSVLGEVRLRYENAATYRERHFFGRLLLDHLDDDTTVWNDLSGQAAFCTRYPDGVGVETAEIRMLKRRDLDPSRVWSASLDALAAIAHDPRARELLHRALRSGNGELQEVAASALARQQDAAGQATGPR